MEMLTNPAPVRARDRGLPAARCWWDAGANKCLGRPARSSSSVRQGQCYGIGLPALLFCQHNDAHRCNCMQCSKDTSAMFPTSTVTNSIARHSHATTACDQLVPCLQTGRMCDMQRGVKPVSGSSGRHVHDYFNVSVYYLHAVVHGVWSAYHHCSCHHP